MAARVAKWKSEDTLRLIRLIELNPCLWNVQLPDFRDRPKRQRSIRMIAETFNISTEEIKKKIHSLRTQYTNERTKMRMKGANGAERYVTKWEFYSAMKFMFEHGSMKEKIDAMSVFPAANRTTAELDAENRKPRRDEEAAGPQSGEGRRRKRRAQPADVESQKVAAINRCVQILNGKPRDEFTVFGENVANEMRLLNDVQDVQYKLKRSILMSIMEANDEAHEVRRTLSCASPVSSEHCAGLSPASTSSAR